MNRAIRVALVAFTGLAGIVAVSVSYERCVEPKQPLWDESARVWPHAPLTVTWDPSLDGDAIRAAMAMYNDRTGCQLLVAAYDRSDIIIRHGNEPPCSIVDAPQPAPEDMARAYLCLDGTAEIHVLDIGRTRWAQNLMVQHELGHVLGLAHDDFSASLMFARVLDFAEAKPHPRLTDKDAEGLRERYCGGGD